MAHGKFEFMGRGGGFLCLFIWTSLLTIFTLGIFAPWTVVAQMRWIAAHTKIDGKQLCFKGSGGGYFANCLLTTILTIITLGIYLPWGTIRQVRWIISNTYFADPGDIEYSVDVRGDVKRQRKIFFAQIVETNSSQRPTFVSNVGVKWKNEKK